MGVDEIELHEEAYSRAISLFVEIALELTVGLSREVYLKMVMHAAVRRWSVLPNPRAERVNYIKATPYL